MKVVFVAMLIICGVALQQSFADTTDEETLMRDYGALVTRTLWQARALSAKCPQCLLYSAGESGSDDKSCQDTYSKLYKVKAHVQEESQQDQMFNVDIAFGYMDFNKRTEDRFLSHALEEQLTKPCLQGEAACGFTRYPDDAEAYYKRVTFWGPDHQARKRMINIHVRSSSVGSDEQENRTARADEQKAKSEATQQFFLSGPKSSDVVFYVGHARDGGGPDFSPPKYKKGSTTSPDYDWYHRAEPGAVAMQKALENEAHPTKLLGIFACYADSHFSKWLQKLMPNSGVILSGQQEFQSSLAQATAALDSILSFRCKDQFQASVNLWNQQPINGVMITGVRMERVFSSNGPSD